MLQRCNQAALSNYRCRLILKAVNVLSLAEKPVVYPGIAVFFQNAFIFFG